MNLDINIPIQRRTKAEGFVVGFATSSYFQAQKQELLMIGTIPHKELRELEEASVMVTGIVNMSLASNPNSSWVMITHLIPVRFIGYKFHVAYIYI